MRQAEKKSSVGYIVSNLSQTSVLSEILALERQGSNLRIFSANDPRDQPLHAFAARVRGNVMYLSLGRHRRTALVANLRLACNSPWHYCRTLIKAIGYLRSKMIRHFFQACFLADMLRQQPVSHIHAHSAAAPALIAMFAHQLTGISYSFTAHDTDIYVEPPLKLLRAEMQRAKNVVTICEYDRLYLSNELGLTLNGKVRCVYKGVNPLEFKPVRPGDSDREALTILSVGRLIEKNGFSSLISTAHILRQRGYSFQLEIIGTGPLLPALQEKVKRLRLEHQVRFLGSQPLEIVRSTLRRATVFLLPCVIAADGDRDSIPTVLLEAMASGVPVVSTMVSGVPELIESGTNGLLVDSYNPLLLADAVGNLLTNPDLRDRLARAARDTVESRFSIERNCLELLALFRTNEAADQGSVEEEAPENQAPDESPREAIPSMVA